MTNQIEYLNINETNAILKAVSETRDRAIIILFLNTGIFLNEMSQIKIDSINWEKKILSVPGRRSRELVLNDMAYEALARWSKERLDARTPYFFITTKGLVKELSMRTIDSIIRKYADQAGISKRVNAQILRHTFAVRLFSEEVSVKKASEILGITDSESITRYTKAAKEPPENNILNIKEEMQRADTRPKLTKIIDGIFPTKPKIAKALNEIKGPIIPSPEEIVFGRDGVIEDIKSNLNKEQSVLLIGPIGIGKSHLLKNMAKTYGSRAIYISSPSPFKSMLNQIYEKFNRDVQSQGKFRGSAKDLVDYINSKRGVQPQSPIIIIDNLQNLRVSDIDLFTSLMENLTILASAEETTSRLKQIWWKFKQIHLNPLGETSSKQLIKYLTQNLTISDYELLETRILNMSAGLPLVIVDMIHQIGHKHVVNREVIRDIFHEAGTHYRDWTNCVMLFWCATVMFRFIALGTHSFEAYILAGFGTAFITMMRFFAYRMR